MRQDEMIKTIQKIESKLFLELKETEKLFGEEHSMTISARSKWIGANKVMEELGIKTDPNLPESQKALELIMEETLN